MLKRDRTAEEKAFDAKLKRGIMRLGQASAEQPPTPFCYQLVADRLGRRGQLCQALKLVGLNLVRVKFEDGFESTMNRRFIRRVKES